MLVMFCSLLFKLNPYRGLLALFSCVSQYQKKVFLSCPFDVSGLLFFNFVNEQNVLYALRFFQVRWTDDLWTTLYGEKLKSYTPRLIMYAHLPMECITWDWQFD